MTRREAIVALGAGVPALAYGQNARSKPLICAYSGSLSQMPWAELGPMTQQMGFDGVDLTVMPGGHVEPKNYPVDLSRAFETVQVAGGTVPMITTSFTALTDADIYPVLYISGREGVRLVRTGTWSYTGPSSMPGSAMPDSAAVRLAGARRDFVQLASLAQRCAVTLMIANRAGAPGQSPAEQAVLLEGIDAGLAGICFDPAQASMALGGPDKWESALLAVLPRVKAVSPADFTWDAATKTIQPCALGDGVVDWKKFFGILAAGRFTGPLSIRTEYAPKKEVAALAKDLQFARKSIDAAWAA